MAQWLGSLISDQGVPGSNFGRCTFRCGLEQVTFTLLSTGLTQEAVDGRPTWTDCDKAGDYVVPNMLSPSKKFLAWFIITFLSTFCHMLKAQCKSTERNHI